MINYERHATVLEYVHRCTIRLLENLWSENLAWVAVGNDLFIEAHQSWQVSCQTIEVVGGEQNRQALFVQIGKQVQNLVARAHIDT